MEIVSRLVMYFSAQDSRLLLRFWELLECYQWSDDADLEHVKEELADVIVYCQNMLDCLGLDVDEIVNSKMTKNEAKYPVEKAKGLAAKYTELRGVKWEINRK